LRCHNRVENNGLGFFFAQPVRFRNVGDFLQVPM